MLLGLSFSIKVRTLVAISSLVYWNGIMELQKLIMTALMSRAANKRIIVLFNIGLIAKLPVWVVFLSINL